MNPFKFEFQERYGEVINELIINNKIVVCLDCLGLRFGRHNIPDDALNLTVLGAAIELKCIVREVEYYDAKQVNGSYNLTVPKKVVFEKNGWLLTVIENLHIPGISGTISKLKHNSKSSHTNQLRTQDEQFMYDMYQNKFIEIRENLI